MEKNTNKKKFSHLWKQCSKQFVKTRVQLKQSENFGRSKFVSTTIFSRDFDDFSWSASVSGFITVFLSMICCWFKYGKDHFDENCLHKEKFSIRSSCYRRLKTHQLNMRSHRTAQTFSYLIYRVLVVVVVAHSGDVWNSKKKSLLLVLWIFPQICTISYFIFPLLPS